MDNLAIEISNLLEYNQSYKDLAKAVAQVLKNEYGTHNFEPFVSELIDELKK